MILRTLTTRTLGIASVLLGMIAAAQVPETRVQKLIPFVPSVDGEKKLIPQSDLHLGAVADATLQSAQVAFRFEPGGESKTPLYFLDVRSALPRFESDYKH